METNESGNNKSKIGKTESTTSQQATRFEIKPYGFTLF